MSNGSTTSTHLHGLNVISLRSFTQQHFQSSKSFYRELGFETFKVRKEGVDEVLVLCGQSDARVALNLLLQNENADISNTQSDSGIKLHFSAPQLKVCATYTEFVR
jgi:hypothetical protein